MSKLDVYGPKDVKTEGWARILLMGPVKAGKTVACAKTSPKPTFVINCEGRNALVGATNLKADYRAADVSDLKSWHAVVDYVCKQAEKGEVQTIVLDTISALSETLVDEISQFQEGYDLWGRFKDELMGGVRKLRSVDAHLIIVAHAYPGENDLVGLLPAIPGKSASRIPAMLSDWIWLDLDTKTDPPTRRFLVGPQKSWNHGARNAKKSSAIDADVTKLIKELGIEP